MSVITWIVIILILAYGLIHTSSYAIWNWRNNNKMGAIFIMLVSAAMIALPVYILIFKT